MSTPDGQRDAEIAAILIEDLLCHVSPELREVALTMATAHNKEEREKDRECGGLRFHSLDDDFLSHPRMRYWNAVMKMKARVAYSFIRNITNNHSRKDAAKLLFERQVDVAGSGYLDEYLTKLTPRPK